MRFHLGGLATTRNHSHDAGGLHLRVRLHLHLRLIPAALSSDSSQQPHASGGAVARAAEFNLSWVYKLPLSDTHSSTRPRRQHSLLRPARHGIDALVHLSRRDRSGAHEPVSTSTTGVAADGLLDTRGRVTRALVSGGTSECCKRRRVGRALIWERPIPRYNISLQPTASRVLLLCGMRLLAQVSTSETSETPVRRLILVSIRDCLGIFRPTRGLWHSRPRSSSLTPVSLAQKIHGHINHSVDAPFPRAPPLLTPSPALLPLSSSISTPEPPAALSSGLPVARFRCRLSRGKSQISLPVSSRRIRCGLSLSG